MGEGEPLLLVHGTGFNADVWEKVMPLLAKRHRVIAYDRRGYQRSTGVAPHPKIYGQGYPSIHGAWLRKWYYSPTQKINDCQPHPA